MPTEAELDRLKGLINALTPQTKRAPGDLIKASDWAVIAQALIDVAQAAVDETVAPVRSHEHPDQVTLGWLDPKLRSLIERGPLSDPSQAAKLAELERRAERQAVLAEELKAELEKLRDLITSVSTRDLAREAAITEVRRTVEGVKNAGDDVLAVRETLQDLETKITEAVEIGSGLKVDGQPVDMQGLFDRLGKVEELRERLIMPTGEVLDAAEFQKQLTTLSNTLVTEDQLDEALEARPVELPFEERQQLEESVRTKVLAEVEASGDALATEIRGETATAIAQVDAKVARAVSDALPGVTAGIAETLRPEIAAAAAGALESATATAAKLVSDARTAIQTDFAATLADLQTGMTAFVVAEVSKQISSEIGSLETSLASLSTSVGSLQAKLSQQEGTLSGINAALTSLNSQLTAEIAVRKSLQESVGSLDAALKTHLLRLESQIAELGTKLTETELSLRSYIDTSTEETRLLIPKETTALESTMLESPITRFIP